MNEGKGMRKFLVLITTLIVGATSFLLAGRTPQRVEAAEIQEERRPVMILGGGIAAMTAANYLSRAGIEPVVITGPVIGGAITLSNDVQNWPGEMAISGEALSDKIFQQAQANGAILRSELVVSVDFSERPFVITTKQIIGKNEELKKYKTDACIIALGATPNMLGVPGEQKYWTRGVYTCAVCDGGLYKDKVVAVVGGGDSALTEVQYLSNIAKKVVWVVRRDEVRSIEKKRAQDVLSRDNVEVLYQTVVKEVKGNGENVTHVALQNQGKIKDVAVDALFLAIGFSPNTDLFRSQLELDSQGYILLKNHQQTSVQGVYAVGDVSDPEFKQAISAAGDGAKAALQSQKFLTSYQTHAKVAVAQAPVIEEDVIEITSQSQFESVLKNAKGPVFVDFYSTRCGPCRTFSPLYDSWAKQFYGKITFLKVNADVVSELFHTYNVRSVPTLMIFDEQGKLVRKSTGFTEISEIDKRLDTMKEKREVSPQDFK